MKNSCLLLMLLTINVTIIRAQNDQTVSLRDKPRLIVGASIGMQWFYNTFKTGTVVVETPIKRYQHIGISVTKVFAGSDNSFYYENPLLEGSYEVGVFGKYFLHGRFTGRKSGFYLGPDIRFGIRKYGVYQYNPQLPNQYEVVVENYKTSKFLLRWGMQWHFGKHVIFEITAPIGFENYRYSLQNGIGGEFSDNTLVVVPSMMFGLAF